VYIVLCSQDDSDLSKAVAASLATFFKQIGFVDAAGMLDNCISFGVRDKRAFWLKFSRKVRKISLLHCAVTYLAVKYLFFLVPNVDDNLVIP